MSVGDTLTVIALSVCALVLGVILILTLSLGAILLAFYTMAPLPPVMT